MQPLRHGRTEEDGFTLIELLVVMIIIGILAAIAVPAFLGQKRKAYETSAKSDVSVIVKEVVSYYTGGSGPLTLSSNGEVWTLSSGSTAVASGRLSEGNSVGDSPISSDSSYCVAVQPSKDGSQAWHAGPTGLATGSCP